MNHRLKACLSDTDSVPEFLRRVHSFLCIWRPMKYLRKGQKIPKQIQLQSAAKDVSIQDFPHPGQLSCEDISHHLWFFIYFKCFRYHV